MGFSQAFSAKDCPVSSTSWENTNVVQGHQLQRQIAEKLLVLPDFSLIVGSDQQFG